MIKVLSQRIVFCDEGFYIMIILKIIIDEKCNFLWHIIFEALIKQNNYIFNI